MQSLAHENGIALVTVPGLRTDLPTQSSSVPTPGSASNSDINCAALEVRWLPSMPLLNKRNTPHVAGIGVLYSEELDQILHIFETEDLNRSINSCCRRQASALTRDPACRICWYQTTDKSESKRLIAKLAEKLTRQY